MMRAAFQSDLYAEIEGPISVKTRWWVWLAKAKAFVCPALQGNGRDAQGH